MWPLKTAHLPNSSPNSIRKVSTIGHWGLIAHILRNYPTYLEGLASQHIWGRGVTRGCNSPWTWTKVITVYQERHFWHINSFFVLFFWGEIFATHWLEKYPFFILRQIWKQVCKPQNLLWLGLFMTYFLATVKFRGLLSFLVSGNKQMKIWETARQLSQLKRQMIWVI